MKAPSIEADPEAIETARQILDAHLRLRDEGYDLQGEIAKAITKARRVAKPATDTNTTQTGSSSPAAIERAREIVEDWQTQVSPEGWIKDEFDELRKLITTALEDEQTAAASEARAAERIATIEALLQENIQRIAELENQIEFGDAAQVAVAMEELRRRLERGRGILRKLLVLNGVAQP